MRQLNANTPPNRHSDGTGRQLTPRQHRLEDTILSVLMANGTRSELRELVTELADYFHRQRVPRTRAESVMCEIGARAAPFMRAGNRVAVGESAADRIAMMVRWCRARYSRVD